MHKVQEKVDAKSKNQEESLMAIKEKLATVDENQSNLES